MTDLQKAIKRLKDALALADAIAAWGYFQEVCQLLSAIIPGFVCPFSGQPTPPTCEQMQPHADEWEAQYCEPEIPPQ